MPATRFFPGPQGAGADIVVPMTDFSLPKIDGDRLTTEALQEITVRTGKTRQRLRDHGFAQGNKIASELRIRRGDVTSTDIPVELYGGPTLRDDISYTFRLPQTPATLRSVPQSVEELLEIYADKMMGGNASNVLRNQVVLAQANIGPSAYHVFAPKDRYLDEWLSSKLQGDAGNRFERHELQDIDPRIGLALPYEGDGGKLQQFSFNRPQGSTIDPMKEHIETLRGLDHVVVSEGVGVLLAQRKLQIAQIFNPTSALHTESALETHRRKSDAGYWQDVAIVNDDEMDHWIKTMENKQFEVKVTDIPDAKFPMPFKKEDPMKIDDDAIRILRENHRRFMHLGETKETSHVNLELGIGCGPKGGQNHFQANGRHFVAAATTLSEEGADRLITLCGGSDENGLQTSTHDVVGAGDAAFTAGVIHRFYSPIEDIVDKRHPNLSDERKRIAAMAFTTLLQRVFGELAFHSKVRDLSAVPPQAFPVIFDKVLDKAIAAAHHLTTIDKVPSGVFRDEEWGVSFMTMEIER